MILKINDRIRNRKVDFFNNFTLGLKYDAVGSSFGFSFYFNPDNIEHKEIMCIGHVHKCTIEHNDELLLTGYILSEAFNSSPVRQPVGISGYSLPGVLEDCQIPPELYPLQSDNLSLTEIAKKLISRFDLTMVVDPAVASRMNSLFAKTTASETDTIKGYLQKLAAQKNIIITHNEKGQLLFTESKANQKPIFHFEKNMPSTSMTLSYNGQGMHSHITVMKQASSEGGNAGESTIINPYVPFVYRPKVITQTSGSDVDTVQAAKNALADELKSGLSVTIVTDRWEIDKKIIKPNNIITIQNPEIYLYEKSEWFIESIDFAGDQQKTVATIKCVLPEVYNGKYPKYLFEGINLH